jgi:hypothetical protein
MKPIVLAKSLIGATASLILGFAFVNCSSNSPDSIGGGAGNNTGAGSTVGGGGAGSATSVYLPDASTSGGGNGGSSTTPNPDANCGSTTSTAKKMPTDVLLVLDRSGSMSESISEDCCCENTCARTTGLKLCADTTNCTQRWPALTSAVTATISKTTEVSWAMKLFSSGGAAGGSCTVNNGVEVQFGRPAADLTTSITGTTPGGATPTAKALTTATDYLKTVKDQNNKVILLATDGEPNCAGGSSSTTDKDGTVAAAKAALAAGFKVYVVGIGPSTSIPNLDSFADAGGTGKYYPATSPDELAKALLDISQAVSDCNFTVDPGKTGDVNNLAVYVDGTQVAKDPANGWSYGSSNTQVVINGSVCEKLKTGQATQVQVWVGCPGSPPPPLL